MFHMSLLRAVIFLVTVDDLWYWPDGSQVEGSQEAGQQ